MQEKKINNYSILDKNYMMNVIDKDNMDVIIRTVLGKLSEVLSKSLGPYGSTTIIQTKDGTHITKDGETILKNIRMNDIKLTTILLLIREISANTILEIGDGSTTSIVAANEIYKAVTKLKNKFTEVPAQELLETIKICFNDILIPIIKEDSKKVSEDLHELKDIATVSTNNNEKLGQMIYEIYQKCGRISFIHPQISSREDITYEQVKGFKIYSGYIDKFLINTLDDKVKLFNSKVIIFNEVVTIDEMNFIGQIIDTCSNNGLSLTIIAPDYSRECRNSFRSFFASLRDSGRKNFVNVIQHENKTELGESQFDDLAVLTGAKIISIATNGIPQLSEIPMYFGEVKEVITTYRDTTFIDGQGDETLIRQAIGALKEEIRKLQEDNLITEKKKYVLEKRIATLSNSLVTIFVGGGSEAEKIANKDLIDDAVLACRSTIDHGYCIGSSLTVPTLINKYGLNDKDALQKYSSLVDPEKAIHIFNELSNVYKNIFSRIFKNRDAYRVKATEEYEISDIFNNCIQAGTGYDILKMEYSNKIINSANTEIQILRSATSIVSYLTLSNQMLSLNTEEQLTMDIDGVLSSNSYEWEE